MSHRKLVYFLFFIFFNSSLFAQKANEYPIDIPLSAQKALGFGPAWTGVNKPKLLIAFYQRQLTGIFKDVYQANFFTQLTHKNSLFSIMAYTDRQGELLKRSRLYCKYSISVEVDKERFMYAGFLAGIVNKNMGDANTKLKASITKFDAGVGAGYYSNKLAVSVALNQIPQSIQKPFYTEVKLKRYISFYSSYLLLKKEEFKHKMILLGSFCNKKEIWFTNELYYQDLGFIAIGIENNSKSLFSFGINLWNNEKEVITMILGYETSSGLIKNNGPIINTFQFGLNLKKK